MFSRNRRSDILASNKAMPDMQLSQSSFGITRGMNLLQKQYFETSYTVIKLPSIEVIKEVCFHDL